MRRFIKPKHAWASALLAALVFLTGCTASIPIRKNAGITLPPPKQDYAAPLGDTGDSFAQTVLLCLPSAQSGQLQMFPERILLSHARHPAEYTLRKLFSYTGTTGAKPLSGETQISLHPGSSIEISEETATVNLGPSALALNRKELYLVCRAITNTLAQWGDIRFVNVLVNNRQQGVDNAATIPLGSLTRTENEDIESLWEAANRLQTSADGFSSFATLFFPASAGRGILAETRTVNIKGRSFPDMARALLQALSDGALTLPNLPLLPDLVTLLAEDPAIIEQTGSTGRVIDLHFHENANEALISSGIPRSILMASLTYTLTTFLPYTAGVRVTIGGEQINAVVPAGLFEGAGEEILFDQGLMQRGQFSHFLLDHCDLYFANASGSLSLSRRAIPYFKANNPRYLINQLVLGPQATDSVTGLSPVLPPGLRDADLLGFSRQGDTVLLNLSAGLLPLISSSDAQQERLMVYAMVNTLTSQRGINRVRFFINSLQEGTFAGGIDVSGEFLRNEGIIR